MADNRTYSLDTLPQEYPVLGTGDNRSTALVIRNADYSECCDLRYVSHEIIKGKYKLDGLPAVYANDKEAETLSIILKDNSNGAQVKLLYGILEEEDIITRSAIITNSGQENLVIEKQLLHVLISLQVTMNSYISMAGILWNATWSVFLFHIQRLKLKAAEGLQATSTTLV